MQRSIAVAALVVVLAALPAAADWLVARDGGRIETVGPWQVKGNLVVFTLPGGRLASWQLEDVDLEASKALTASAAEVQTTPQEEPPPPRPSVYRITDADVGHVDPDNGAEPAREPATTPETAGEEPPAGPPTPSESVRVVRWENVSEFDLGGIRLEGVLRNDGSGLATAIAMVVEIFDENGTQLAEAPASLIRDSLLRGQTTDFEVVFPDITEFASIRFDVSSTPFAGRPEEAPEDEADLEEL